MVSYHFGIKLTAVAGKTTCLDVLAQRKNIGVISGDVLVDGRPLTSDFARGTAYGSSCCYWSQIIFLILLNSGTNGCSRGYSYSM